jgi:WD40 repeat protein/DNA-binding SARP family transcriptional activator
MSATGIALLGPLVVNDDGGGEAAPLGPRDRVVLAALAVRHGEVVSAEQLADALWGERPPVSWNKVVPGCVMRLRRVLGAAAIETTPHGYRLVVPVDEIDAQRFERLVRRGGELLTLGEPERAAHVLGEALALWRGRALIELTEWEPGRTEATRLDGLRLDAEEARVDACLKSGRHREVLGEAQSRVAEAPLRERRWALLALAQYLAGRQGEALRTLRQARSVLATELGLDPGPELVAMEQAILRQDPALVVEAVPAEASLTCPYLGLVPYDVRDSEGFFGRDLEITECVRRLAATQVLAVVGPSGSGKSSLVRAGVASALQRAGRRVVVVTPGARPVDTLSWLPVDGDAVLVVDQCEETLTLCEDSDERAQFFTALVDLAQRSPLVVAVRADRLADLSAHLAFARLVERGLYLLGAMDEANLRAAIEGPAHQAGLLLEPGLVELLVREVAGEPGALPLLSHALRQTWLQREGRTLTVAGYQETGGIRGAVAQSAEDVYQGLPAEQQPMLRDLLLRLVAATPDGVPVRSRVPRRTLVGDDIHDELIEQLVAARLVTSDGDVVEVAHEALAVAWPRLRGWLEDDVEGQRILRHVAGAADTWDAMDRPESELYRGLRLAQALEWRDRTGPNLGLTEQAFLDAGKALAEAEQRTAEDQARRQVRINRRLRVLLAGVAVLLAASIVAGLLAWRQTKRADDAAAAAEARRLAALVLDESDNDRALLLAVEAARLDTSPASRSSLLAALSRNPALIASTHGEESLVGLDVSADGRRIAVGGPDTALYDAGTLGRIATTDQWTDMLAFQPDGRQLAAAAGDFDTPGAVRLLDALTLQAATVQLGGLDPRSAVSDIDYSADGRFLAASVACCAAFGTESTLVWDLAAPARPFRRIPDVHAPSALSPDGRLLYGGSYSSSPTRGVVTTYDTATGQQLRSNDFPLDVRSVGIDDASELLEVSPDGTTLGAGDFRDVVLLDASTLSVRRRLEGLAEQINMIEFSHDGTMVAAGTNEGTVVVWDAVAGTRTEELHGGAGPIRGLAFGPDDATLYSASDGLLAWDLRGDRGLLRRIAQPVPGDSFSELAVPSPGGDAVAYFDRTVGDERADTIQFRDLTTGEFGAPIATERSNGTDWRPADGEQFATADGDGFVRVWDWRRGELITEQQVAQGDVGGIAYTPDGRRIVVGERSGAVFQVDAETLRPAGDRVEVGSGVREVFTAPGGRTALVLLTGDAYASIDLDEGSVVRHDDLGVDPAWLDVSPDGSRLAVGATTGEVGVIDLRSAEWVRPPTDAHEGWVQRVAYAPDGATFASSGSDGQVTLWDGRTGERLAALAPGDPNVWTAVDFQSDGHTLIAAGRDGAVHTLDTRLESWVDRACDVAGRNFTQDEWAEAIGDRPYHETCPPPAD